MLWVTPGVTAGRGLERIDRHRIEGRTGQVTPGVTAGRGLEQCLHQTREAAGWVTPGVTAGRGLERNRCPVRPAFETVSRPV